MRRTLAPVLALATIAALAGAPATLAKEWLEATLDAPIAMGTPGGTEILVGLTVVAPDPETGGRHPVEGSPIYVRLTGRDGSTTREAAAGDRTPGHYTVRIAIPEGGARDIEVGIHGTTDLPIMVMNDPFAFGAITARTAQLAPAIATPAPAKPLAPAAVAEPAKAAPVAGPPPEPIGPAAPGPVLLGAVVALGVLAVAALLAVRRRRTTGTAPRSA